ncbi:TPA_asm: hypothetical protein [Salvia miltiorrhiza amalgavirus 1]|nr:TPA_asm: hypothetical protein [Salvia miltiorrhiza amalgavirus 1]
MAAPGAEIPRPAALAGRPVVDHRAFINAQGARLIAIGVPAPCFDEPNYLAAGLTPKLLEGRLRVFEHADSDAKLQRILNIGIRLNRFPAYASLTPPLFYSFLDFLRTPAGADELAALQRADKLATRGGTDFEPHELGWIAMMDLQQAEMSNLLGEERRHHDDVIADLERRLRMAKVAQKEALAQVKTNHSPAGDYVALDSTETNRRCWAEYCNRVVATGNVPPPLSYERMCEAVTTYSDLIRKRHILEFLTPQARKDALESFVQRLIVGADQAANERQSRRFRGLLADVGRIQAPPPPPQVPQQPVQQNPAGPPQPQTDDDIFRMVVAGDAGNRDAGEAADSSEGETSDTAYRGAEELGAEQPIAERTRKRARTGNQQ